MINLPIPSNRTSKIQLLNQFWKHQKIVSTVSKMYLLVLLLHTGSWLAGQLVKRKSVTMQGHMSFPSLLHPDLSAWVFVSSVFTDLILILRKRKLAWYDAIKSNHLHTHEYGWNKFISTPGVNFYNIFIWVNFIRVIQSPINRRKYCSSLCLSLDSSRRIF